MWRITNEVARGSVTREPTEKARSKQRKLGNTGCTAAQGLPLKGEGGQPKLGTGSLESTVGHHQCGARPSAPQEPRFPDLGTKMQRSPSGHCPRLSPHQPSPSGILTCPCTGLCPSWTTRTRFSRLDLPSSADPQSKPQRSAPQT